jgi:hypothetical protein
MKAIRKPASTGAKSAIGQERRQTYAAVWNAINHADQHGCWLEVITLCESLIADRLEARLAFLADQSNRARRVHTANAAAGSLLKSPALSDDERQLCEAVRRWSRARNTALHELAKLIEGTSDSWDARWEAAKQAAEEGRALARLVSNIVQRANRYKSGARSSREAS